MWNDYQAIGFYVEYLGLTELVHWISYLMQQIDIYTITLRGGM